MKTLSAISRQTSGNILMLTLVLAGTLTVSLGGYLWWVRTQNLLVAESQAWNAALAAAEAGIEEGMAQINVVFGTNYLASAQANWGGPPAGPYGPKTNSLLNASYSAIIIPGSPGPTIIATGYVRAPVLSHPIQRTVQVTTTFARAFGGAMTAWEDVTMKGNTIMIDSYDSSDPNHSTIYGRYDPLTRKSGGDVATTSGVLDIGNANVYGHVYTAPWGTASTLANGRVGDLPPSPSYPNGWAGTSGIQDGWYLNDFNAVLPDVTPPDFSSGSLPVVQNNDKLPGYETNSYTLGNGNYFVSGDFKIANNETLWVTGNAILWVQGSFSMSGMNASFINIAPGYTLTVYVGTENVAQPVSASFTTVNEFGPEANAWNFQLYGLPSATSLSWSGNSSYMGTVYAPQAVFNLSGGGATTTNDYQGSCTVKSISLNGHFNIHYDENLKKRGPISGFIVNSWREL